MTFRVQQTKLFLHTYKTKLKTINMYTYKLKYKKNIITNR